MTDRGQLYTCGNGRHGKLGLFGVDDSSSQFVPTLVSRFNGFQVQQVNIIPEVNIVFSPGVFYFHNAFNYITF